MLNTGLRIEIPSKLSRIADPSLIKKYLPKKNIRKNEIWMLNARHRIQLPLKLSEVADPTQISRCPRPPSTRKSSIQDAKCGSFVRGHVLAFFSWSFAWSPLTWNSTDGGRPRASQPLKLQTRRMSTTAEIDSLHA